MAPKGWGQKFSDAEVLIVITRDAFTWLPKMYDIVSCCSICLPPLCLFSTYIQHDSHFGLASTI